MKNHKKLSLDKIKIARLTNSNTIKGGSIIVIEEDALTVMITDTNRESLNNHCDTSTKTVPIGTGSIDLSDINNG